MKTHMHTQQVTGTGYFREPWRKKEHLKCQKKRQITSNVGDIRIALDFSTALEAIIPVKNAFKILSENNVQPKILYFYNYSWVRVK